MRVWAPCGHKPDRKLIVNNTYASGGHNQTFFSHYADFQFPCSFAVFRKWSIRFATSTVPMQSQRGHNGRLTTGLSFKVAMTTVTIRKILAISKEKSRNMLLTFQLYIRFPPLVPARGGPRCVTASGSFRQLCSQSWCANSSIENCTNSSYVNTCTTTLFRGNMLRRTSIL